MKRLFASLFLGIAVSARVDAQTSLTMSNGISGQSVETIVCIRHGEKLPGGLGQLNCQGLNRALALPKVLLGKYGPPGFVFAPNPAQKSDGNGGYYYVRPLVTIEPTAIRCGLPINTQFGYREIKELESELGKEKYQNALVYVAWEHGWLDKFAKNLLKSNRGNPTLVPPWPSNDFDTIFVIKITRVGEKTSVDFSVDHEGLNNLSGDCP